MPTNKNWGNAISDLVSNGWDWDEERNYLTSPSGERIENPTPGEALQLLTGMSISQIRLQREDNPKSNT